MPIVDAQAFVPPVKAGPVQATWEPELEEELELELEVLPELEDEVELELDVFPALEVEPDEPELEVLPELEVEPEDVVAPDVELDVELVALELELWGTLLFAPPPPPGVVPPDPPAAELSPPQFRACAQAREQVSVITRGRAKLRVTARN